MVADSEMTIAASAPTAKRCPSLDFHGTELASHHVRAKTHFSAISLRNSLSEMVF
jgi:hypothetical protein